MLLALLLSLAVPSAPTSVGRWIETHPDLGGVHAVASHPNGGFACIDRDTGILRVEPAGTTLDLGRFLHHPEGLAIGDNGVFFVADTGRHRVMFFDVDGRMFGGCGGIGDEDYRLRFPAAVDVNEDMLVVADTGNDRIQVYEPGGSHIRSIAGPPDDPMRGPEGVAIDEAGRIWVADTHNHCVRCLQPDGTEVKRLGSWGTFPGQFMEPSGIDVHGGLVVVTDRLNHRVQVLSAETGVVQESWGMHSFKPRQGEGRVHYPTDAAVIASGDILISEPFEERVQLFGPTGAAIETPAAAPRGVQSHFGPIVATDGRFLCTWEPEIRAIHVFDLDRATPIRLSTFGAPGTAPGKLGHLTALAVDATAERLWAIDAGNGRVHEWVLTPPPPEAPRFDPTMATLSRSVPLESAGPGTLLRTGDRLVYVDRAAGQAITLNEDGLHTASDVPDSRDPAAVLTSGADQYAVLDASENMIRLYDWPGAVSPTAAIPLDECVDPTDLAATADGSLVVLDRGGHRVYTFRPDGTPGPGWGTRGIDHAEFWRPAALVVDHQDRVIVLDHGNHRAQMFSPDGDWLMTFGTGRAWTRRSAPRDLPASTNEGEAQ